MPSIPERESTDLECTSLITKVMGHYIMSHTILRLGLRRRILVEGTPGRWKKANRCARFTSRGIGNEVYAILDLFAHSHWGHYPVGGDNRSRYTTKKISLVAAVGDIMMGTTYPAEKLPPHDGGHLFQNVEAEV